MDRERKKGSVKSGGREREGSVMEGGEKNETFGGAVDFSKVAAVSFFETSSSSAASRQ